MSTLERIRARADELQASGLTRHRTLRRLKMEFPNAERDFLVRASRIPGAPTGVNRLWTYHNPLNPVTYRAYRKKGVA